MKIAHIGSTAVPGLAAKDIIDIQIGVHDLALDVRSKLSEAGYEFIAKHSSDHVPQGDGGIAGRWNKLYFHGRAGLRPCHVHVRDLRSPTLMPTTP
jgi:dephospho-CoA kinase